MRIANLLVGSGNEKYPSLQVPHRLVSPGVEVEIRETDVYLEPRGAAAYSLLGATVAAAAVRAEREGFDAAFINTTSDYGLPEIRSLVGMPVVGCGEAGIKAATSLGSRFAIVQVWPEWSRPVDEFVLARVGLADRCCAIRNVSSEGEEDQVHAGMIEGNLSHRQRILERITKAIDAAVREDGAEVILLGCTCMSSVAEELSTQVDVPVVDPMVAGFLAAEQLARSGVQSSAIASDREERARLAAMFEAVGTTLSASEGTDGNLIESCSVCVTTPEVVTP